MPSEGKRPWTVTVFESWAIVLLAADLVLTEGFSFEELIWIPLYLWMILSISRKKSALARTIFTALCAAGWIVMIGILSGQFGQVPPFNLIEILVAVADSAATAFLLWLLWSAPTSAWLATRHHNETNPISYER